MLNPVVTPLEMELDGKIETCQSNFSLVFGIFTALIEALRVGSMCVVFSEIQSFLKFCLCFVFLYIWPQVTKDESLKSG